jgi:predicted MFS family arabinose efflux permease
LSRRIFSRTEDRGVVVSERFDARNVFLLAAAQAVGLAGPPIIIILGGVIGQMLSPDPALVTLPVSLHHLGLALGTIPAALIIRQAGRRSGYLLGAAIGLASGLVATYGLVSASFVMFCIGTMIAGVYGSFVQNYRFAAADSVAPVHRPRAIAWVMIGGLCASIIGPQLTIWARDAYPGVPFAGSFLAMSILALIAMPIIVALRIKDRVEEQTVEGTGRPLAEIIMTPRFLLAAGTGVVAYGMMSFVMTASPIAMVGCGHSVGQASLGIQWHVLAMFIPSFFTGHLISRFGKEWISACGLVLIALSAVIALMGLEIAHFWISLVFLGVGWNFGFIGATSMLADCYRPEERSKVQGMNDFLIFGTVAATSFFSGSLLNSGGWDVINWLVLPAVAIVLAPLLVRAVSQQMTGAGPTAGSASA